MLYDLLKKTNPCEETSYVKVYKFLADDKNYKIIVANRKANRRSVIHCVEDRIEWEQFPLLPRIWAGRLGDKLPIYKFEKPKNETVIFLIKGEPRGVIGLDDGLFRGVKKFDSDFVNVMAYKYFKNKDF